MGGAIAQIRDRHSPALVASGCRGGEATGRRITTADRWRAIGGEDVPILAADRIKSAVVAAGEGRQSGEGGEWDDILPKLMASTISQEDLFKKDISKYDQICQEIAQNIEAQEELLLQIQAQNDKFSSLFNLDNYQGILSFSFGSV
ncbi:hypothetical protein Cni_G25677 [Canna indica]|uniref:ALIX V-shaped domain-containing protein n=1 Tax=Canna indica TaxID=4628 RepID=A0AAQ3QMM4_9LILI|nr:hypothetical protein Cni_G25677 [Canna indica]